MLIAAISFYHFPCFFELLKYFYSSMQDYLHNKVMIISKIKYLFTPC